MNFLPFRISLFDNFSIIALRVTTHSTLFYSSSHFIIIIIIILLLLLFRCTLFHRSIFCYIYIILFSIWMCFSFCLQAHRERRRIDRNAQIFGEIGQRSDMVLMAMRDHDAEQIVDPFLDEGQVGQDDVDAGILRIGKGDAEIDHHPFALAAIQVDVHADFAGAAKATEKEFVLRSH